MLSLRLTPVNGQPLAIKVNDYPLDVNGIGMTEQQWMDLPKTKRSELLSAQAGGHLEILLDEEEVFTGDLPKLVEPDVTVVTMEGDFEVEEHLMLGKTIIKMDSATESTITFADLTAENNDFELVVKKIGAGDIVIDSGALIMGAGANSILTGSGDAGESVTLSYDHDLGMFCIICQYGTWTLSAPE